MTINGTKLSVRLLGATLALATCGLLTGNAQAQNRLFVGLSDNSIVSYDISLTSAAAVEASKVVFTSTNLFTPFGLAFDSTGNLYAANYASNKGISKFDSTGTFVSTIGIGYLNGPYGLAFDSSGNLYAANGNGNNISKFDSSGSFQSTIGSGNLSAPIGIAFDSSGNLYAANFSGSTIKKFNSSGTFVSTIGSGNLNNPFGLAFDSSGNLYAANNGDSTISKFDSSGTFQTTIGSGNLNAPFGLAFDSSGNLFASNYGNNISKFDSSGSFLFRFNTPSGTNPGFLTIGGSGGAPPPAVPEPGAVAFGIIAAGSVLGLVARKRRS